MKHVLTSCFFRDSKLSISSVSWKLASIPRINTNNCAVSCMSVLSFNASEYHKSCLLVSFSWLKISSLIFLIRLTTVLLYKAILSILVFYSGHMILAISDMHSLTNSPSENDWFLFVSRNHKTSCGCSILYDWLFDENTVLFFQRVH